MAKKEYIEREAAKKEFLHAPMTEDEKILVIRRINSVPAADVVPVVSGRWVHSPDTGTTTCTACGWSIEECFYDASTNKDYPFCPNCGAKMDGGVNDATD